MSQDKILPNVVGRMDDVVEAIREGDAETAIRLMSLEIRRRNKKIQVVVADLAEEKQLRNQCVAIQELLAEAIRGDDDMREQWDQLRRECGYPGPEFTNFDEAIAEAYEVAKTLVYDAPEGLMETSPVVNDIAADVVRDAVEKTDHSVSHDNLPDQG